MNRILGIAVVICLILLILAIFISPVIASQPSALRAQQWLSHIVALFSFALQLVILLLKFSLRIGESDVHEKRCFRRPSPDLTCCLVC